ncbi:MAG: Fe-S cluster assembly protein SufD [Cyclobacteriaceae bacterium]|nr:Fe-S cluster assembly protein SufD [Cyclobacteriaceae bacterium]
MSDLLQRLIKAPESDSFSTAREAASTIIKERGLPSRKNEEYKYTNLSKILERNFGEFGGNEESATDLSALIPDLSDNQLVFVNGILSEELSSYKLPEGITISTIEESKELVEQDVGAKSDEFLLLNTSSLNTGITINIAKSALIEKPIVLIHITDSSKNQAVAHPRVLINGAESAQATIAELFIGNGDALSFTNAVTEINCAASSNLSYIKIGNENGNQLHVGNTQVNVAEKAIFNAMTVNFGGKMVRNNLQISLNGSHSEANLDGLYVTDNKEHIDNHTVVDHKVPNCNSNELYKGIMNGSSKGIFNGKIYVRQDAQVTNAFQSNKNILLSDNATINTKPQLEIWADDVKCSHGCTTGKLDKEQLFYLRARGIGEHSAKLMLLDAYANEVIERIKDENLRTYVQEILHTKIDE